MLHVLHVWNIYQHVPEQNHPNVVKYTTHGASWYVLAELYNHAPTSENG